MVKKQIVWGVEVTPIPLFPDAGDVVISSEQLVAWEQAEGSIQRARRSAAEAILRARRRSRSQRALEKERNSAKLMAYCEQLKVENLEYRKEQMAEAVKWLVDEQNIEAVLYKTALMKAKNWAVELLQSLMTEVDWGALLALRVKKMQQMLRHETELTLRLPAGEASTLLIEQHQTMAKTGPARINTIVDHSLAPFQASLSNRLIEINVDVHAELEALIEQLQHISAFSLMDNDDEPN